MGTGNQITRYTPGPFITVGTDIENATIVSVLIQPNFGVLKDTNDRYYFWGLHTKSQFGTPTTAPRFLLSTVVTYPHYISSLPSDVTSVAIGINTLFATRSGGGIYIW